MLKSVLLVILFATLGCACNQENSLRLSLPDGNQVTHRGSIRIIAEIKEQGNPPEDDSEVLFTTTVGSFEPYTHGAVEPVQQTEASTVAGQVEVTLHDFPGRGGVGQVSASYVTFNGITVTGEATITVSGGGKASGATLHAFCDPVNVAVYADPAERTVMQVRCVAQVKNIHNESIPGSLVLTKVESGCGIHEVQDDTTTDAIFVLSPTCDPLDVEPFPGEPNHPGVQIHNPRDGLLTLIFYTDGEEGYQDANANGQYDEGETFDGYDLSEPYVDSNDSNWYDPGEPFVDVDGNGEWSPPNGVWDGDTKIWVATRLMFTGRPHESINTTRFEPATVDITNAGTQTFTLHLVDINYNPLASHHAADGIEFNIQGARIMSGENVTLDKAMGASFLSDGSLDMQSLLANRTYQVTLEDSNPDPESTPTAVTLQTQITWTAAPDYGEYDSTTFKANLSDLTGMSD